MATAATLYTPEVLALATSLAQWPLHSDLVLRGSARSATCGSTLDLGLGLDDEGRISAIGMRAHACAIGQAAAAVFAGAVLGRSRHDVADALEQLSAWLRNGAAMPQWPGLPAIAAAQGYPARHGAVLLAWQAALDALPSDANPR